MQRARKWLGARRGWVGSATLSQNVRACGLRRTRYRGLPKTHVQHVLTALACNVTRIADWIPPRHLPPGQPQPRVAAPAYQRTRLGPSRS
ncbi:transposase [Streptomyces sp. NPDC057072]|uniref:transposase n=1 Tax=Streptomyces sp. NPDC057072 TaxID=3346014 RepID=UPI00363FF2FD